MGYRARQIIFSNMKSLAMIVLVTLIATFVTACGSGGGPTGTSSPANASSSSSNGVAGTTSGVNGETGGTTGGTTGNTSRFPLGKAQVTLPLQKSGNKNKIAWANDPPPVVPDGVGFYRLEIEHPGPGGLEQPYSSTKAKAPTVVFEDVPQDSAAFVRLTLLFGTTLETAIPIGEALGPVSAFLTQVVDGVSSIVMSDVVWHSLSMPTFTDTTPLTANPGDTITLQKIYFITYCRLSTDTTSLYIPVTDTPAATSVSVTLPVDLSSGVYRLQVSNGVDVCPTSIMLTIP